MIEKIRDIGIIRGKMEIIFKEIIESRGAFYMYMKYLKLFTICLVVLFMAPNVSWSQQDCILEEAFCDSGADFESAEIVDWSVINREFMEFEEMERKRDEILYYFSADGQNFTTTKEFDDMYRIIISKGWLNSGTFLQIILQSVLLPEEYGKDPQTYMVINIITTDISKVSLLGSQVSGAINENGGQSRITTCYTGTFNGKLNEAEKQKVIETILEKLQVSDVEKVDGEHTLSLVGYSPLLHNGITICDKEFNLNIAMRFNDQEGKTYLWIGTPVISLEY